MNYQGEVKRLLVIGEENLEKEDYRSACKAYERVVEIDPNNANAYISLVKAFTALWNYRQALDVFKKMAEHKPMDIDFDLLGTTLNNIDDKDEYVADIENLVGACDNADTWSKWAKTLSSLGKYKEASEWYRKSLDQQADNPEFLIGLSKSLSELSFYEESIDYFCKAMEKSPDSVDLDFLADNLKQLNWEHALVQKVDSLVEKSDNANVWSQWAYALHYNNKYKESIDWFCKTIEKDPDQVGFYSLAYNLNQLNWEHALVQKVDNLVEKSDNANVWSKWASALGDNNKYKESIDFFCKTIEKDPDSVDIFHLAYILNQLNWEHALVQKVDNLVEKSDNANVWSKWASALGDNNKYKESIDLFCKIIEKDPDSVKLNFLSYYLKQANWENALVKRVNSLLEKSNKPNIWCEWAQALSNEDALDQAIVWYSRAAAKGVNDPSHYYSWANALYNLNKYRQSISKFKNSIEKDSNYVQGYEGLGKALVATNQYDEAIEQFEKAISIAPDTEYAYIGLIDLISKMQNIESFKVKMNRLMERVDNTNVISRWAEGLSSIGAYPEAVEWYTKGINKAPDLANLYDGLEKTLSLMTNPEQTIASLQKTVAKISDPIAWKQWGKILASMGRLEEAVLQYNKALKQRPVDIDLHISLRTALKKLNDPEGIIGKIQKTIDYLDSAMVNNEWGYTFNYLNRYSNAIVQYQKALSEYAYDYIILNIGWALKSLCRFSEAITQSKIALKNPYTKGQAYELWGSTMLSQKNYQKAAELYEKASKTDTNTRNKIHHLFNWALALSNLKRYEEAIAKYREVIALDDNFPYSYHNIASIYENQGNYLRARETWDEALRRYELYRDNYKGVVDYFFYYGAIYHEIFLKLEEAEKIYRVGLDIDPNNPKINIALALLYIRKKEQIAFSKGETLHKVTEFYWKAWELYRCVKPLEDKWAGTEDEPNKLIQLSRLEIELAEYQSAKKHLRKVLKKDDSMADVFAGLGTIAIKENKSAEAIKHFKSALQRNPDDLKTCSNLAEAYFKAKMIDRAENEYNNILKVSPCHVDALIGLGNVYTSMGDSRKKTDRAGAEDFYDKAIKNYTEAVELASTQKCSRKLTEEDFGSLLYSRGYASVMLFECRKIEDRGLLNDAHEDFNLIHKNHPNYHKAMRAIEKITDRLEPSREQSHLERWGPLVISILAVIVFLTSHLALFVGLPQMKQVGFSIDNTSLNEAIIKLDTETKEQHDDLLNNLKRFEGLEFSSRENLIGAISKIFENVNITEFPKFMERLKVLARTEQRFEPIEIGSYAILTFGSLIFLVAGLYLKQISKLKFGGIELEKSSMERISITGPIGVTK
ncbi:MAG: tetratricopeptide repeat protein [Candidatus Hodarchaeota archaeon]